MKKDYYDVAIVGSGPAGMFAALALTAGGKNLKVAIFEKGKIRVSNEIQEFRHPDSTCHDVNITEGWGGAGAFSDGKFNLDETGRVGGQLVSGNFLDLNLYCQQLNEVSQMYINFGGSNDRCFGKRTVEEEKRVTEIKRLAAGKDMVLYEFPILHLGTSQAQIIVENIRQELVKRGVEIFIKCPVKEVFETSNFWRIGLKNELVNAKRVVLCPGRSGSSWLREICKKLGIKLQNNGVDVGVRVETSMDIMSELVNLFYEAKIYFQTNNDDKLRTFCMCPHGIVAIEEYRDTGIWCANGHTDPQNLTDRCNFAILQTQQFTEPFDDPLSYGRSIAALHTMLSGGGVLLQRLGDLRRRQRSNARRIEKGTIKPTCHDKNVIPGDIGLAMPGRFLSGILEFLEALDWIVPGINSNNTLLYSPEIKFNSVKVVANSERAFETLEGLHVAGDGSGYTRGLNQASVMGLLIGRWIAENL